VQKICYPDLLGCLYIHKMIVLVVGKLVAKLIRFSFRPYHFKKYGLYNHFTLFSYI